MISTYKRRNAALLDKLQKIQLYQEQQGIYQKNINFEHQKLDVKAYQQQNINLQTKVNKLQSQLKKQPKPTKQARIISDQLIEQTLLENPPQSILQESEIKNVLHTILTAQIHPATEEVSWFNKLLKLNPQSLSVTLSQSCLKFIRNCAKIPSSQAKIQNQLLININSDLKGQLKLQMSNSAQTTYKCLSELLLLVQFILFDHDNLISIMDQIITETFDFSSDWQIFTSIQAEIRDLLKALTVTYKGQFSKSDFVKQVEFYKTRDEANLNKQNVQNFAFGSFQAMGKLILTCYHEHPEIVLKVVKNVIQENLHSQYITNIFQNIYQQNFVISSLKIAHLHVFYAEQDGFVDFTMLYAVFAFLQMLNDWEFYLFERLSDKKVKYWQKYDQYLDLDDITDIREEDEVEVFWPSWQCGDAVIVKAGILLK